MSIRQPNVFLTGEDSQSTLGYSLAQLTEAPDFYTSITVRRFGSGTREKVVGSATITEEYDYDESVTFTRVPIATFAGTPTRWQTAFSCVDSFPVLLPAPGSDPSTDCCITMTSPANSRTIHLRRHYLNLWYYWLTELVTVGTQTISDPYEVTDIVNDFEFVAPAWSYTAAVPDFGEFYDQWEIAVGASGALGGFAYIQAADIADWLDLRGTITKTVNDSDLDVTWDTNSVTHSVSLTIA